MNPLDGYPQIRKYLYIVQYLVNGVIAVAGAYYVLSNTTPDKWYVITAGLGPVLWAYLGLTASKNVDPIPLARK